MDQDMRKEHMSKKDKLMIGSVLVGLINAIAGLATGGCILLQAHIILTVMAIAEDT